MPVKLRLQRRGRRAAPFYHIVAADSRSPRDGRFIEKIGTYNPLTVPATIDLNLDRAFHWLTVGAQPTDTVNAILRLKGVLYRKHLQKGVAKGAFDQEKAEAMLATWLDEKSGRIDKQREASTDAKKKFVAAIDGVAKVKVKPAPPVEEVAPEVAEAAEEVVVVAEEAAPAVEEAAPVAEEVAPAVEEAAPVTEEVAPAAEEAAPEAPAEEEKAAE